MRTIEKQKEGAADRKFSVGGRKRSAKDPYAAGGRCDGCWAVGWDKVVAATGLSRRVLRAIRLTLPTETRKPRLWRADLHFELLKFKLGLVHSVPSA